jgi:LacI family transcriptional regulator
MPAVRLDNAELGREAARHFLARQFKHFGVYGFWHHAWSIARANGFAQAVAAAGHPCSFIGAGERPLIDPMPDTSSVLVRATQWLYSLPRPCAVYVPCDAWAIDLASYLRMQKIRVPEDFAVIGTDNDEAMCELASPPLSSVMVPWRRLGQETGLLLERVLAGAHRRNPPALQPLGIAARHSTSLLAVADDEVAQALAYIYDNVPQGISVSHVLRHVPVHQHRLERKFKTVLGRRMMEVIAESRVDLARRLLVTTGLSMPELADRAGFASASKLSVAFRRATGYTPTAYRQRYRIIN